MYIRLGEREEAEQIKQSVREEMAKKLLARGDYSPEDVSEIAEMPVERVRALVN